MNRTIKIGTHNGVFHADDVFAVAAIQLLNKGTTCEVVRTRDPAVLATCDIVIDVGGVSDPQAGRFDHHQKGGAGVRENGVPYSSFGLVWKHYGHDICGSMDVVELVDKQLVQSVCAQDCGYKQWEEDTGKPRYYQVTVSGAISGFNPCWHEEERDFEKAFGFAVEWASDILERAIVSAWGTVKARAKVAEAVLAAKDGVVILEEFVPWGEDKLPDHCLFVVFPAETGDWRVQCAPGDEPFSKRKALPASWGGLRGKEMAEVTGVEDSIFTHIGLFICGAQSRTGALQLAFAAVRS